MKLTKRLFTAGVALALTLSLNVPAFAEMEGPLTGGSITIDNAVTKETYSIYQIAYIESYSGTKYAYKANSQWQEWLAADENDYVDVDASGYVTWTADETDATYAAFAQEALAYAQTMNDDQPQIEPDATKTAAAQTVSFSGLNLGWYLVDTSTGSICSLDTTDVTATIHEKNTVPTITKSVYEDSKDTSGAYVTDPEFATGDISDDVLYKLVVNTGSQDHATGTGVDEDYVITDVLPEGMSFKNLTAENYAADVTITTPEADSSYTWTNNDYDVAYDAASRKLTITLKADGKLGDLDKNTDITITYAATINGTGVTGDKSYTNEVTLSYKEQTLNDTATIKTYDISNSKEGASITKIDGTTKKPLEGVKFILSKGTGSSTEYAVFTNNVLTDWTKDKDDATKLETGADGSLNAYGLDADTYYLTETDTLPGYNLLKDPITVTIDNDGTVTYSGNGTETGKTEDSITIANNSGVELPSTGGMGTTVLYIAGVALALGAGITLVVRRRMNSDR